MTKSKTIFYQAQEAVVSALSQDEVLSSRVPFVSENQLDIEFQIKSALGKQGIVGIVMTPQAAYQGTYQGQDQVWDLRDFTIQVVENPIVNRTHSISRDPMTAFDAVTRATEVLASPMSPLSGQYCPTTIEQGEDSGLIVAQTKFNCQVRADKGPERSTKWKYAGSDEWHTQLVEGEFTSQSVPDIGDISEIEIGYSVTSIAASAFQGCSNLNSVAIPSSVTAIGAIAFENCTRLSTVDIPSSVASLEERAFRGCTGLTTLTIGNGVASIGDSAFWGCTSLTDVTMPDSVTSIGVNAFWKCSGLTSVTIGNSVESIGEFAFYYCTSLQSVTIPDSLTSIGYNAFNGCTSMAQLLFEGKTGSQVKAMANYSWGLPESAVKGAVPEILWSLSSAIADKQPEDMRAGDTVTFTPLVSSDIAELIAVDGVEQYDTSKVWLSSWSYTWDGQSDVSLSASFGRADPTLDETSCTWVLYKKNGEGQVFYRGFAKDQLISPHGGNYTYSPCLSYYPGTATALEGPSTVLTSMTKEQAFQMSCILDWNPGEAGPAVQAPGALGKSDIWKIYVARDVAIRDVCFCKNLESIEYRTKNVDSKNFVKPQGAGSFSCNPKLKRIVFKYPSEVGMPADTAQTIYGSFAECDSLEEVRIPLVGSTQTTWRMLNQSVFNNSCLDSLKTFEVWSNFDSGKTAFNVSMGYGHNSSLAGFSNAAPKEIVYHIGPYVSATPTKSATATTVAAGNLSLWGRTTKRVVVHCAKTSSYSYPFNFLLANQLKEIVFDSDYLLSVSGATTAPTWSGFNPSSKVNLYVKDSLVDTYKADANWGAKYKSGNIDILPISTWTNTPVDQL